MKFQKERIKDLYLLDTRVENIFINEYLPVASGDFVKVYIFISMYAEHQLPVNIGIVSRELQLKEETVKEAITFWEEEGLLKRITGESDEASTIIL